MATKHSSAYVKGNDVRYGLEIAHCHPLTGKVIGLQCRFCIVFGREEKVGSKRKPSTTVQGWNAREWSLVQWLQVLNLCGEDVGLNPAGKLFTPQKISIRIPNLSLPPSLRRRRGRVPSEFLQNVPIKG